MAWTSRARLMSGAGPSGASGDPAGNGDSPGFGMEPEGTSPPLLPLLPAAFGWLPDLSAGRPATEGGSAFRSPVGPEPLPASPCASPAGEAEKGPGRDGGLDPLE